MIPAPSAHLRSEAVQSVVAGEDALDLGVEFPPLAGQRQWTAVPPEERKPDLFFKSGQQSPDLWLGAAEPVRRLRYRSSLNKSAERFQTALTWHSLVSLHACSAYFVTHYAFDAQYFWSQIYSNAIWCLLIGRSRRFA